MKGNLTLAFIIFSSSIASAGDLQSCDPLNNTPSILNQEAVSSALAVAERAETSDADRSLAQRFRDTISDESLTPKGTDRKNYEEHLADTNKWREPKDLQELQKFGLTDEERVAIFLYTTHYFGPVNKALYANDQKTIEAYRPFIEMLSKALRKLPDHPGLVNRGVRFPDSVLKAHQVGAVVQYPAFTSTSANQTGMFSGLDHRLTIRSKHGKDISAGAALRAEREVLFLPGTRFRVTARNERTEGTFTITEIELEEL